MVITSITNSITGVLFFGILMICDEISKTHERKDNKTDKVE